jgi:hypothetical protein
MMYKIKDPFLAYSSFNVRLWVVFIIISNCTSITYSQCIELRIGQTQTSTPFRTSDLREGGNHLLFTSKRGYSVGGMVNPISINAGRYKSQRTNGRLYYNGVRGYGTSKNYAIWFAGYTVGGSVSRQVMQYSPPNFSSSPYSYNGFSISNPYSNTPFGFSKSYTHTWISRF